MRHKLPPQPLAFLDMVATPYFSSMASWKGSERPNRPLLSPFGSDGRRDAYHSLSLISVGWSPKGDKAILERVASLLKPALAL